MLIFWRVVGLLANLRELSTPMQSLSWRLLKLLQYMGTCSAGYGWVYEQILMQVGHDGPGGGIV